MKAAEWIDRVKAVNGWDSDYRAAKELGLSRNTVSVYRSKPDATMDDDTAVKVAEALAIEPEIIIIDQVTERTRSEPARAALTGLLERIAGTVRVGGSGAAGGKGRLNISSASSSVADPERAAAAHARARYALHLLQPCSSLRRTVVDWLRELYTPPTGLAPA